MSQPMPLLLERCVKDKGLSQKLPIVTGGCTNR